MSQAVGATSSRLAKVAHIADLLRRAEADDVAIVVSWLSGELRQRQIGVGWAALQSPPPPAPQPTLTVGGVDAAFSEIGAVSGKGSQGRRAELLARLFAAATETEQAFLLRLLGGELRQGALAGVMADAVARGPGRSRRSRCGWAGPSGRCWPKPPPASPTRSNATMAQPFSRPSWTVPACRSIGPATRSPSTPEASTTSPPGCPRWSRPRGRSPSTS
ncbi:ATP-dependent DNA ligase [Mycobacterium bohemicum DSM 44277]|uniref:ATP-dependent DNA ligase n=1 Tax=Mycobacterium bohemicum DSM 44277 TaxID=1236609 RepID=A0A0U0WDI2_MYCBE|nr:ATP-dependent DNA ligase [Mycobacterium bohemicum DSM 44277]